MLMAEKVAKRKREEREAEKQLQLELLRQMFDSNEKIHYSQQDFAIENMEPSKKRRRRGTQRQRLPDQNILIEDAWEEPAGVEQFNGSVF